MVKIELADPDETRVLLSVDDYEKYVAEEK
jgi:hypothetical protein